MNARPSGAAVTMTRSSTRERTCSITFAWFKAEPASSLKEMLVRSLGVLVVVDKRREIYFIDNVKFHVDLVAALGTFIEIEAIDADGSIGKQRLLEQCQRYVDLLCIQEHDLLSHSYSDLLLEKAEQGSSM